MATFTPLLLFNTWILMTRKQTGVGGLQFLRFYIVGKTLAHHSSVSCFVSLWFCDERRLIRVWIKLRVGFPFPFPSPVCLWWTSGRHIFVSWFSAASFFFLCWQNKSDKEFMCSRTKKNSAKKQHVSMVLSTQPDHECGWTQIFIRHNGYLTTQIYEQL